MPHLLGQASLKMKKKKSQGQKTGNTAVIDPEILRYKANRIELMEIEFQERGRMEFDTDARERFSWG